MQSSNQIERVWVEVLAHVYKAVNWRQVCRNRSAYDVFEHRLEFSKYEPDIPSVLQRLCNSLSLQAPPLPLDDIEFLRENEKEALKVLRKWTKLLVLKAAKRAKEIKEEKKKKKEECGKQSDNTNSGGKSASLVDFVDDSGGE